MKSGALGKITSEVEIANISSHGIWLLSENQELFLSYDDFPWFKDVTIQQILNVEEPMPGHFYWPDLDVDLSIESIEQPEKFPLKARTMDRGQHTEVGGQKSEIRKR